MSHDTPTLSAETRENLGSRYARRLRNAGRLPAVIYGHQTKPVAVSVAAKETLNLLHHGIHVFNVSIDGASTETCLVKELQFGYLGDNVIHVDFARVDLEEVVEVSVHLRFVGTPESARKPGSILSHDIPELLVRCKVQDIPEEIKVDLSKMGLTLTVGELELPPGIEAVADPAETVCRVESVEDVAEGEAATTEGAAAPEVIGEKQAEESA